jgi:hypothetical protein
MTLPIFNLANGGPPNRLASPEDFSAASWSAVGATMTAHAATNPVNGTNDAWALVDDTSTGGHLVLQNVAGTSLSGLTLTLSIYAKAGSVGYIALGGNGGGVVAWFNLSAGAIGTVVGGTGAISSLGGGWYRCSFTYAASGAFANQIVFYATPADATLPYTGTGATALDLYLPALSG